MTGRSECALPFSFLLDLPVRLRVIACVLMLELLPGVPPLRQYDGVCE